MTSICNILNSFGNKEIYCHAMSGNKYKTAEKTGPRWGGGWGCQDRRMDVSPCPVRSASSFFPNFIENKKQKQQQALRDEY